MWMEFGFVSSLLLSDNVGDQRLQRGCWLVTYHHHLPLTNPVFSLCLSSWPSALHSFAAFGCRCFVSAPCYTSFIYLTIISCYFCPIFLHSHPYLSASREHILSLHYWPDFLTSYLESYSIDYTCLHQSHLYGEPFKCQVWSHLKFILNPFLSNGQRFQNHLKSLGRFILLNVLCEYFYHYIYIFHLCLIMFNCLTSLPNLYYYRNFGLYRCRFPRTDGQTPDATIRRLSLNPADLQDRLEAAGFEVVYWHGRCNPDELLQGHFEVLAGMEGTYALFFDNTFSKTPPKLCFSASASVLYLLSWYLNPHTELSTNYRPPTSPPTRAIKRPLVQVILGRLLTPPRVQDQVLVQLV